MKVFTIIVTYNGEQWIEKCLQALQHQSEVVVVDNHSSDATVAIIQQHFPWVILLQETTNHGFGKANNIGIKYALEQHADAVFLLNQDAYVQENTIQNLIETCQNHPEYGILSPVHLNGDGTAVDMNFLKFIQADTTNNLVSDLILQKKTDRPYPVRFVNAAAWLLPAKVCQQIGGFDPIFFLYGEDDNYCQRVLFHGFKIGVCTQATVFHDSPNNNNKPQEPLSEKALEQFHNQVKVRFGNVNTNEIKKINAFKRYLKRKAWWSLCKGQFRNFKVYQKRAQRIAISAIQKSYSTNKTKGNHYL